VYRFYIPPAEWNPGSLALTGAEAHHCHDVMRCQTGDEVIAFDGAGTQVISTIAASSKSRVELDPGEVQKTEQPPARLTLCQAIPKGKNMELVVQKATELGAAEIVPLITEHTIVRLKDKDAVKKQAKWQRTAIEACKQSGQNWLPHVATPITLSDYFSGELQSDLKIIASLQTGALHLKEILAREAKKPTSATVLVGPEGDFSVAEVKSSLAGGFQPITLGPIILRTETAALYCLSVLAHELFAD